MFLAQIPIPSLGDAPIAPSFEIYVIAAIALVLLVGLPFAIIKVSKPITEAFQDQSTALMAQTNVLREQGSAIAVMSSTMQSDNRNIQLMLLRTQRLIVGDSKGTEGEQMVKMLDEQQAELIKS